MIRGAGEPFRLSFLFALKCIQIACPVMGGAARAAPSFFHLSLVSRETDVVDHHYLLHSVKLRTQSR